MIRALQKISGKAKLNAPAEVREMAFENAKAGIADMFATHPPIEKRIEALAKFAGGRIDTESRPKRRSGVRNEPAAQKPKQFGRRNPWGRPGQ